MGEPVNFLIKCGISRKIVKCWDIAMLLDDIKKVFSKEKCFPNHFRVQFKHKDFDEYIDLDSPIQLQDRLDNNLLILPAIVDEEHLNDDESSGDESASESSSHSVASADTIPYIDDNNDNIEEEVRPDVQQSWPAVFLIQDATIRNNILERLRSNLYLSKGERASLCGSIYDICTKYTYYPTSAQYNTMATAVLEKWPHLKTQFKNYADAHALWKHRLRVHFKNTRRRTPNIPEINMRKRKATPENETDDPIKNGRIASKSIKLAWGIPNFLPSYLEGEDDETMVSHQEKLLKEAKLSKEKRNTELVEHLMNVTFPHRRKMIVTDLTRLSTVIMKYPLLQGESGLFEEFQRLSGFDILTRLRSGLEKYHHKLISMNTSTDKGKLQVVRNEVSAARNEASRTYYSYCLALLTIPHLIRENAEDLLENGNNQQPRLRVERVTESLLEIVNASRLEVVVEDTVIAVSNDFIHAFALVMASHYIFNVVYSTKLEGTFLTVQKMILDISDGVKAPNKVLNLMCKIQKV